MSIAKIHRRGMWQIAYKATDVLCEDGRRRTVKLTSEPDTFYTIPAAVSYRNTTVTGFIMTYTDDAGNSDIKFIATGKHKDIFSS